MEKRVLLAVFLSFLVLYGYQALFPPPKPVRKAAVTTTNPATSPAATSTAAAAVPSGSAAAPPVSPTPVAPAGDRTAPTPDVAELAERAVIVQTSTVTATFSNRGGVVTSWKLTHYKNSVGEPVDLVPETAPGIARPFSLRADDPAITDRLNGSLYRVTVDG